MTNTNAAQPKPHKHAALIKAWADGAEIEVRLLTTGKWVDCVSPKWSTEYDYRIKPVPKPDIVSDKAVICMYSEYAYIAGGVTPNVRFTFDGHSRRIKAVELIGEAQCVAE